MKKVDTMKICVIIITICVMGSFLMSAYYNMKYTIVNHEARKLICDTHETLVYIQSLQAHNDIVRCCELVEEHGVDHITYCEDILIR